MTKRRFKSGDKIIRIPNKLNGKWESIVYTVKEYTYDNFLVTYENGNEVGLDTYFEMFSPYTESCYVCGEKIEPIVTELGYNITANIASNDFKENGMLCIHCMRQILLG